MDREYDKLDEEVAEYYESRRSEELADILEVVYTLGRYHGRSEGELQDEREQKADERGRFEDQIVLEGVDE